MIRTIQNYPGAGQKGQTGGQVIRKDRKSADFGSMLQRQMRESQASRPESGFEDMAARAAAEAGQAAAIRQAMGLRTGLEACPEAGSGAAAVNTVGAAGTAAGSTIGTAGTAAGSAVDRAARQTVNFSKHALARAEERGIELTDTLLSRLADSVERAQGKGVKNILAFDSAQAFIINIPYSRVITAISRQEMRENIFTNIDGAVLL